MTNPGPIQKLDNILGRHYLAIQDALKILEPRQLKLADYEILVVVDADAEADGEVIILFGKEGERGAQEHFGVRRKPPREMDAAEVEALLSRLPEIKTAANILGPSLLAVQTAVAVFLNRTQQDLNAYKIEVVRDGDTVVVIFSDKDLVPGTRGIRVGRPGFEVAMRPSDLKVVRSQYTR